MVIRSPENGQCGPASSARSHENWRKPGESRNPVPWTKSLRELTPFVVTALFAICKKIVTSSRNRQGGSPAIDVLRLNIPRIGRWDIFLAILVFVRQSEIGILHHTKGR